MTIQKRQLGKSGLEVSALLPYRGKVIIATKFRFKKGKNDEARWTEFDSRPKHIREVAEASLKRLKVDMKKGVRL